MARRLILRRRVLVEPEGISMPANPVARDLPRPPGTMHRTERQPFAGFDPVARRARATQRQLTWGNGAQLQWQNNPENLVNPQQSPMLVYAHIDQPQMWGILLFAQADVLPAAPVNSFLQVSFSIQTGLGRANSPFNYTFVWNQTNPSTPVQNPWLISTMGSLQVQQQLQWPARTLQISASLFGSTTTTINVAVAAYAAPWSDLHDPEHPPAAGTNG